MAVLLASLTPHQLKVLDAIKALLSRSYGPSVREIALEAGVSVVTAHRAMVVLERSGHITRPSGEQKKCVRAIALVGCSKRTRPQRHK